MVLPAQPPPKQERVVYLLGAGASHACAKVLSSSFGVLMSHLNQELADRLRAVVESGFAGEKSIEALLNSVIDERTDFEHLITFLDESPSELHRDFAGKMRSTFQNVLKDRLTKIKNELGTTPDRLYFALLDMYEVPGLLQILSSVLTIN